MDLLIKLHHFLIDKLKKNNLPGKESHLKMIPQSRLSEFFPIPENARKSSVMILLFEKDSIIKTILIKRPVYNGVHSAQIAFPGGSFQESDITLKNTALRETKEEIGLDPHLINVIGKISDIYIPPSNFIVTPFIGYVSHMVPLTPHPKEVEKIIFAKLDDFMFDKNIKVKNIKIQRGEVYETPYYDVCGETIWGATAMILKEFTDICNDFFYKESNSFPSF